MITRHGRHQDMFQYRRCNLGTKEGFPISCLLPCIATAPRTSSPKLMVKHWHSGKQAMEGLTPKIQLWPPAGWGITEHSATPLVKLSQWCRAGDVPAHPTAKAHSSHIHGGLGLGTMGLQTLPITHGSTGSVQFRLERNISSSLVFTC